MSRKLNLDEAMRASIAIISDYETTDFERIDKVASAVRETAIEKVAGIYIDKPTLENCEDFIRKFMYNELSFFPRILELNVSIIPQAFSKSISDHIDVATGIVQIKVRTKILEIPFIINDGELDPFDIIQLDGQRVPYSRDNLQKIIINLDKQLEREEQGQGGEESPYASLEEYSNPSTSAGFMGDVLSIRDSQSLRRGNGMYATAYEEYSETEKLAFFGIKKESSENFMGMGLFSKERRDNLESNVDKAREKVEKEKPTTKAPAGKVEEPQKEEKLAHITNLNDLMDKVHDIKPMSDEQYSAIAEVINKKAYIENKNYLEKLAAEAESDNPTRKDLRFIEAMNNFKFDDISRMQHGDIITLPEMKDNEFSLTPAIVFTNTSNSLEQSPEKPVKFLVTFDGRIKVLNGDKLLCKKSPEKKFKIPRVAVNQLQQGDRFFIIKDNEVSSPYQVSSVIKDRTDWDDKSPIIKTRIVATHVDKDNLFKKEGLLELNTLQGKKFEKMTADDFIIEKQRETGIDEQYLKNSIRRNAETKMIAVDPEEKVFKITGSMINGYKSNEELSYVGNVSDAGLDLNKVAFSMNTITIECCDRRGKLFNLIVEYKDTDARLMNLRRQNFNRINEGKLKAILRILKFQGNKLSEVIYKAKNEPRCNYPIPVECTIEDIKKIQGGNLTNVSSQTVKRAIGNYINPSEIGKTLATATIGGLVADAAMNLAKNPGVATKTRKAFEILGKISSESKEISAELEKLAQKIESDYILDMAKTTALSAMYHDKVAFIIEDENNFYPELKSISKEISMARPVFEKMAYDLTVLKVNQGINQKDIVNPALVNRAINSMNELYKTASIINKSVNEDNLKFL